MARRGRNEPSGHDLEEARRLAGYGNPPGWVDAVFYALHVWPHRRRLARLLRETTAKRDAAITQADAAYLELGKRLHSKSHEVDMTPLRLQLSKVDHAVLHADQVRRENKRKQDRLLAQNRADDALRKLGEAALEHGMEEVDREGTARVVAAVREANGLSRQVRLRQLGIDSYDEAGVRRGAFLLVLVTAFIVVTGVMALRG